MRKKYRRKEKRKVAGAAFLAIIMISILIGFAFLASENKKQSIIPRTGEDVPITSEEEEVYHVHADFVVIINGEKIDFSSPIYNERDPRIHLHTPGQYGGDVMHVEARGAVLGDFFTSVGMRLTKDCFSLRGQSFCNNENNSLKFHVNKMKRNEYNEYSISDLDRILISYGNETSEEIQKQSDAVTEAACVFSGKCSIPGEANRKVTL